MGESVYAIIVGKPLEKGITEITVCDDNINIMIERVKRAWKILGV